MLKNEMKAIFALMGTVFIPMVAQADQSMNNNQTADQTNQQTYVSGEIVKEGQLPAGYNASAAYKCVDGWDVFVTADYIYWAWQQDSFQLGTLDPNVSTNLIGSSGERKDVFQNPGYASGFQVGLGFNMPGMDDWNLYTEYTWYKNSDNTSVTGDAARPLRLPTASSNTDAARLVGTLSSDIAMKFDSLDFLLKRPFYFGKKLTANFAAGLRALWITQTADITQNGLTGASLDVRIDRFSDINLTSWGLGPKFGLETNWMLGCGFQIMANLSASALYTRYNHDSSGSATIGGVSTTFSRESLENFNTVRPITEMFLGLGWNTGFYDDNYRIALSVGYDFDVYWDYNMIYYTTHQDVGNMYLQGLNIAARFDF